MSIISTKLSYKYFRRKTNLLTYHWTLNKNQYFTVNRSALLKLWFTCLSNKLTVYFYFTWLKNLFFLICNSCWRTWCLETSCFNQQPQTQFKFELFSYIYFSLCDGKTIGCRNVSWCKMFLATSWNNLDVLFPLYGTNNVKSKFW